MLDFPKPDVGDRQYERLGGMESGPDSKIEDRIRNPSHLNFTVAAGALETGSRVCSQI